MLNIAKSIDSPDLLLYEFMTKKKTAIEFYKSNRSIEFQ